MGGGIGTAASAAVCLALLAGTQALNAPDPARGAVAAASERAAPAPRPLLPAAYFRPVVAGGKAFPVARSTFYRLLSFEDNWHAPRLRLIGGEWLLVGVHEGIDIAAEPGTPVVSMTAGAVERTGWTFYSGLRVGVRGVDGRYYLYAHLSALQRGLRPGTPVEAGSVLGLLGNTGYGPPGHRDEFPAHLHFGIEAADGSAWVDPYATLVSLYERTVATQERWRDRLLELAARGDGTSWEREAARVLMRPSGGGGE